jgi:hypothetical protein
VTVKFKVIESRSGPRKLTMLEWDWAHGDVSEIDMAALRAALDPRNKRNLYED